MKFVRFLYTPRAEVVFTADEIRYLLRMSAAHYDGVCKQAGRPGKGGFLWGIHHPIEDGHKEVVATLTSDEIQILAKINEVGNWAATGPEIEIGAHLLMNLGRLIGKINEDYYRVNPSQRPEPGPESAEAKAERELDEQCERQTASARESLKQFPCSGCDNTLDVEGPHVDHDERCPACRITMGERIALGTLLLAGPEMETKVAAFIREHRITQ